MPKNKKIVHTDKLENELPETADAKRRRRKNFTIVIASAILAVIIGVSVFGWYLAYKKPLLASVATINKKNVAVEYVLRRCLMSIYDSTTNTTVGTADPLGIIQSIIQEQLILQNAAKAPYNIKVTDADIDKALRDEANANANASNPSDTTTDPTTTTPTVTMSEVEFREWYRQTLNQSRLSDAEFRELVRVSVMSQQLYNYLADRMSTTVEQVHLWDIVIQDETIANDVKTRIDNGEDFSTIAKELSTDSNTSEQGGDMGWVPLDILDSALKYTAQDLEIGKVSYPTLLSTASQSSSSDSSQIGPFYLLMVTEKDPARPVTDPTYINSLKGLLIQNWITAQMNDKSNKIELHGRGASGGYDSTTNAWILYQMERLKRSYGIQDTTTTSTTTNPVTGQ